MSTVESNLVFLISTPRAGSTMLMRILNATSAVMSRPEPHLVGPLAHLGFWDTVDKAPYDQLQAQDAARAFVRDMPAGEQDYWDACRAYLDVLYGRMLETAEPGERYFLDKTPANALVLPFLRKVYPQARFIVLTRHPAAVFASYANSFFDGDFQAAADFNPVLSRYVPVMAAFLRDPTEQTLHVSYEQTVTEPEATFSTCFGAPFMPRHPSEYGNLLRDLIAEHSASCWLVNTGWTGGAYGIGNRMPIRETRALLSAALDGSLNAVDFRTDENFGFEVPVSVPGVDGSILNPRDTWADPDAYDAQAAKLVAMFVENFAKFIEHVDDNVRAAALAAE